MYHQKSNLIDALQSCKEAAYEGHAIAQDNLNETATAINKVSVNLSKSLNSIDKKYVNTPNIVKQLKSQLTDVVKELESLQDSHAQSLQSRRQHLEQFSIALFGRTMAGKSTLMEILTQGDGSSIGTGSQRTTRDVRAYTWRGLRVIDVPGVAAFEGAEDEELAFKAASEADLVLFLITDDAPQPAEAECLARIKNLGKPVLGICNVKVGLEDADDLILFLKNPNKSFDKKRIGEILSQFNALTSNYTAGERVPFIATHLHSKYLSLQSEHTKHRHELLKASRFNRVEDKIIQEVTGRGSFLRVKSFIDGAVVPMMDLTQLLLKFSEQNSSTGRVLIGKRKQLVQWSNEFIKEGNKRINTLILQLMETLRSEVPSFCEDYYDSDDATKRWNKLTQSKEINKEISLLREALIDDCQKALAEIARELKSELSLMDDLTNDANVETDDIFDTKRALAWGTNLLAGGLGIAAVILSSPPLGIAAVAVGVVGWFFSLFLDSREKKVTQAREKMSNQLNNHIDKIESHLKTSNITWFQKTLIENHVYVLLRDFAFVISGLFELADVQRDLAWTLNKRQKVLGKTLINKVLEQLNSVHLSERIVDVARIPGVATMLLIKPNTTFSGSLRAKMQILLNEKVWFVIDTRNKYSILAQAIGKSCDRKKMSIEQKIQVAHVAMDEFDDTTMYRVQLAQQLTSLHIMK